MSTAASITKLLRACVDDELTLEHERQFVDPGRAETLTQLARERERFVIELQRLGRKRRRPSASVREILHEGLRALAVAAAGRSHTGDAISSCNHSRARTEALYDRVMPELPPELRRIVDLQRERLHDEKIDLDRLQPFAAPPIA